MALSTVEKTQVIYLLGYPGKVLVEGSTHYDPTIARRLNDLTPEIEDIARACIADVETVKSRLLASQGRMLVKKVGDIELNTDENMNLKGEYRRLLEQLATLLDIPNRVKGGGGVGIVGLCV